MVLQVRMLRLRETQPCVYTLSHTTYCGEVPVKSPDAAGSPDGTWAHAALPSPRGDPSPAADPVMFPHPSHVSKADLLLT